MVTGTGKALADEWYPRRHQQKRLQMKSTLEKWILRVCWLWKRDDEMALFFESIENV
jgi:hypothetical protein